MDSTSTCSVLHDTKNNKLEANFLLKQWEINNELQFASVRMDNS